MPARSGRRPAPLAALSRYRTLLALPGAVACFLSSLPARFGAAMLTLGLVVLVHAGTGSYAAAGSVAGVYAAAAGLGSPLTARLADRYGQRRALPPTVAAHVTGVLAIAGTVHWSAPAWTWYAAAVVAGSALPSVGSMTRARWTRLTPDRDVLSTAYALESLTDDLTFVVGPALATVLGVVADPVTAVLVTAVLTVAGGVALSLVPAGVPRRHHRRRARGPVPLAVPGMRVLVSAFVGVGMVFSGIQVSLTAFATARGVPGVAGPLYSGFGIASMVAGLAFGAARWRSEPWRRFALGLGALATGCLALPAAGSAGTMAAVLVLPGLAIAPTVITGNAIAERLVPRSALTETFAWLGASTMVGVAAGSTLAGWLVDAGPRRGFALPIAAAASAALLVTATRRFLRADPVPAPEPRTSDAVGTTTGGSQATCHRSCDRRGTLDKTDGHRDNLTARSSGRLGR